MGRYRIELVTSAEDGELRALFRNTPMPGAISVAFHREPSFFGAAVVDGRFRQIVAARDEATGQVVGVGSRSIGMRYVNGRPTPIGYLSGLRLLEAHRRAGLLARGYRFLRTLHEDARTPLYLTTITEDNTLAKTILTSARAGLPTYSTAGKYHTAALPLTRRSRGNTHKAHVEIRHAQADDLPAILRFLSQIGPQRQFFPCYHRRDFAADGLLRGLHTQEVLLAFREDRIVGTLAAWDQRAFRQEVVTGYSQPLRSLRPAYNLWARLCGRPPLPQAGEPLRCLMGTLPLVADDDPDVFSALLGRLVQEKAGREWDYLLVGMHESDPLLAVLQEQPARWYTTGLYLVHWDDGAPLRQSLDGRPFYLELGSL